MLIVYTLLLSTLSSALLAEDPLTSSLSKSKRGIVEPGQNVAQDNKFYQSKLSSGYQSQQENQKLLPKYKSAEPSSYHTGYKFSQGSGHPQYSYQQGPIKTGAYTGLTYPGEIHGSGKYTFSDEGSLFTLPRDVKAISETASPTQQISTSERQVGDHNHQRAYSYTPSQGSFNKLALAQSPHALGFASYSGIDQTQPEEARGGFPSLALQAPVYKSTYPPVGYAPSIQTSARAPSSPAKLIQSGAYNQPAGSVAGNINGKKIPVLQVESGKQLAGYSRAFDSQPLILSTGLDYQGSLPSAAAGVQPSAPFFAPVSGFQAQVVPIQTSSGSPQFPQYRGARVQAYPVITNPSKTSPTYQPLLAQPHLHFGGGPAAPHPQPVNTQPGLGSYGTAQKIRSDVEIINKEKPQPPTKDEDDDNDKGVDHGFDVFDKQYNGRDSQENKSEERGKPYIGLQVESDFKPSRSYPFKQYDDTFGKYSKSSSEENSKPGSKYTSQSSSSEEEDEQRTPSAKYSSSESSSSSYKSPYSRYEHEEQSGEEESDKDASQSSAEQKSEYSYGPKTYKHPSKDFGQNSEESKRKVQKFRKYN